MIKIEQRHREAAAEKLRNTDPKLIRICEMILRGEADDHPAVQAAAFYEK